LWGAGGGGGEGGGVGEGISWLVWAEGSRCTRKID